MANVFQKTYGLQHIFPHFIAFQLEKNGAKNKQGNEREILDLHWKVTIDEENALLDYGKADNLKVREVTRECWNDARPTAC